MKKTRLYIISVALLLAGILASLVSIYFTYGTLGKEMQMVMLPGSQQIMLDKGEYVIYNEYRTWINDKLIDNKDLDLNNYDISLKNEENGVFVELEPVKDKKTYSYKGREGEALYKIDIGDPGTYELTANLKDAGSGNGRVFILTVDRGFLVHRLLGMAASNLVLLIPAMLALIIFVRAYTMKEEKG